MQDVDAIVRTTQEFVRSEVLPIDDEHDGDVAAAGGDGLRVVLQAKAREAGILAPHGPVDCGGMGLSMQERAPVFEAAGYSIFGPMAINVSAPDEGNIHMLDHIASPGQRERFLAPLVQGELRSAFAMTEPAPGAGSDPSALATPGHEGGRRLGYQRPQALHHRRRRGRLLHRHGSHQWGTRQCRWSDDVPGRPPTRPVSMWGGTWAQWTWE